MRLLDNLMPRNDTVARSAWPETYSFQNFVDWFTFQSHQYGISGSSSNVGDAAGFENYIEQIHRVNPIISAATVSRALLLSQWRPIWRNRFKGSTFGDQRLTLLERPGALPRGPFYHLAEMHCQYAGAAYPVVRNGRMYLLNPQHVSIVLGSNEDPGAPEELVPSDAEVVGLIYQPVRNGRKGRAEAFFPGEFTIIAPEPDPVYWWRGQSWVSALIREIGIDEQVTDHQTKFFKHAAVPSMIVTMNPAATQDQVTQYADAFNERHSGTRNRHRTLFVGGGVDDVKVVGSNLADLSLKDLSGGFESRVAARSMVPAVILNIRESMAGSALNSGNYAQTRRQWADKWFTPTADIYAEALERLIPNRPGDVELSWNRRRVTFLQEDEQDAAEIRMRNASTMRQLVDGGFDPDSVVAYVDSDDLTVLTHTGLLSVQVQEPGAQQQPAADAGRMLENVQQRSFDDYMPRWELHTHTHVSQPDVTVETGEVRVQMPEQREMAPVINVNPTPVTVQNTVEPAPVAVENRVEVNPTPVNVDVSPTPVTVDNRVDVNPTPVTVDNRVDVSPTPVNVDVSPTPVSVDVSPTPVNVDNTVNVDTPPAQVTVVGEDRPSKFKVRRDRQGRISEVDEVE